jgi:hypothetical protein
LVDLFTDRKRCSFTDRKGCPVNLSENLNRISGDTMKALLAGLVATGLTASLVTAPTEARAGDGGAVAAGISGGLAAGAIIGSAAARPPVVVAPAPVYAVPPPPPPTCYWAPGAAVWDPYRAAWVRPQVQVCN